MNNIDHTIGKIFPEKPVSQQQIMPESLCGITGRHNAQKPPKIENVGAQQYPETGTD